MTPDKMAELAARLHDFGKAYPVEIFPEITDEERAEHSRLITRAAAQMGRHFAKFAVPAADLIAGMAQRVPLSEADVEALAFRADTQGGGEGWAIYFARLIEQAHGIKGGRND